MNKLTKAVDLFNNSAKIYEEKYMNVDVYAESLNKFCDQLSIKAKVLEFACGPGNVTRYILDKRPDLEVLSSDMAPNMIELAKKNCPEAKFEIIDIKDLSGIKETYDGIVIGFILPYLELNEVKNLLSNLVKLLNPGGAVYISTMEREKEKVQIKTSSSGERVQVNYYGLAQIKSLLEDNGFLILNSKVFNHNSESEMEIIAKLKEDSI